MSRGKFISLAEHNPELIQEWDFSKNINFTPQTISYGSAQEVHWKCAEGHEWVSSPNHRTRGRGCPECAEAKRKITLRKNIVEKRGSLADRNPDLAQEWHPTKNFPLTAKDISVNSSERVWWQCSKDKRHEWDAPINSRNSGVGCPVCSGHKLVVGINDLATVRPDLKNQWHPTKNEDLKPTDVTIGSEKKVWWRCPKDEKHEWEAKINNRTSGNNCPFCAGKKVLVGYNDLATVMPSLAKEWHPTKNGDLTPQDVVAGSNKKVWWKCERDHEWQTTVSHRSNGRRCPKCFGESKTSFPEQAIFFYFNKITTAHNRYMIDPTTEIDVYLPEYKIGIEYDGAYYHNSKKAEEREVRKQEKLNELGIVLVRVREIEGKTGEYTIYVKPGANDTELSQMLNTLVTLVSNLVNFTLIADIDVMRDRNKIYEQYIQSEKENSLAVKNPQLAKEWNFEKNGTLLPEYVSVHSNKKVWWKCGEGHEWQAVINSRKNGVGCPFCAGKRAILGKTDLATLKPELVAQWNFEKNGTLLPQNVTVSSNKLVWWKCSKGHDWKAMIYDRSNGQGCPICSGHKVLIGYNDLETVNPILASEWHPTKNKTLKASNVTSGSSKKVWWRCKEGHEWEAVISSRNVGYGCPYCAGQKVIVESNDLATTNPKLAAEWHPTKNGDLTPSSFMSGSSKKVWWRCKEGHEWEAVISSRKVGRGCPYCAGQKVIAGSNDLATTNPKLAAEWHPTKNGDLTPSSVMSGSNKKVWWKCGEGHEWQAVISSRSKGAGCKECYQLRRKASNATKKQ